MTWLPKSRRVGVVGVGILIVGYLTLFHDWVPVQHSTPTTSQALQVPIELSAKSGSAKSPSISSASWTFDAQIDRNNHALTADQCSFAFPELYYEIDRAAAYWKERQGNKTIAKDQWGLEWSSDGGLSVMIYNQQVFVTHSRGLNHFQHWKERSQATLHQIQRAVLASPEPVPNIEFSIKINDNIGLNEMGKPDTTVWAFSRNIADPVMEQVWLIPDFNFWTYPRVSGSFGAFQQDAIEIGNEFDSKKDLLVWRGTIDFNWNIRDALLRQSEGQPWSDVHKVAEDDVDDKRISMTDHCRYKYAVHTEGTTWSGRLKYLLSCHSVIFIHTLTHYTHLYHLLEPTGPTQNFVPTTTDWVDLPGKIEALIADPAKARSIADNAAAKFRDLYFTPAAQTCYWRRLFDVWSDISVMPDPFEVRTRPDGKREKVLRGMTYEEYVFWDKDVPKDA